MKEKDFCKYSGDSLIKENLKQVDAMLKYYMKENSDPEIIDDLIQVSELGHKLVEHDYFSNFDLIGDYESDMISKGNYKEAIDSVDLRLGVYEIHEDEFNKDRKKFFNLIGKYSGEWI